MSASSKLLKIVWLQLCVVIFGTFSDHAVGMHFDVMDKMIVTIILYLCLMKQVTVVTI